TQPRHDHGGMTKISRRVRAMLTMLVTVAVFALMDAGLKQLSAHYPPFQVAALRGASSLPLVLAWALATTGVQPLLRVRWSLHLLRGVIGVAMMAAFTPRSRCSDQRTRSSG